MDDRPASPINLPEAADVRIVGSTFIQNDVGFRGIALIKLPDDSYAKVSGASFNMNSRLSFINPRVVGTFKIPTQPVLVGEHVVDEDGDPINVKNKVQLNVTLCGLNFSDTYYVSADTDSPFLVMGRVALQGFYPCQQIFTNRESPNDEPEFDMCVAEIEGEDGENPHRWCRIVQRYFGPEEAQRLIETESDHLRNKNYEPEYGSYYVYFPCPIHFNFPDEAMMKPRSDPSPAYTWPRRRG